MRIRPLTGQVLVQILPRDKRSAGGIEFPDEVPLSPEAVQAGHRHPEKPKPHIGIVREMGRWPKTRNGLAQMPQFGIGAKVIVGFNAGIQMRRDIGENFRMVLNEEVIAVLT